ncbi:RNA methyltransferase, TrmH family, group 3 [Saprolegnia diclina VS20]|uniref:rRNA methyltransferase 1, mitochondrial n=1 Tax=Saprolegnia diclina (strain VS20) TaxID=1156394 RepID=T0SE14_SAPDV|nr:RNA methyltransferase, TrmH family, group 3 [Saprolegnia diclina VS20]EQC41107.1 RNA methyltransferase, TrmH family, group 3 [Saprolegnia diclina VS20]|eukprot:XP_008605951.1 RNA methyltransferase, TrmH family, group 3 [Saprolegnia diclina VS20]
MLRRPFSSFRPWKQGAGGAGKRKPDAKSWLPKTEPPKVELPPGEALYGIHGVRQALRCNQRAFHKLYLRDTNDQKTAAKKPSSEDERHLKEIKAMATDAGIPIVYESKWLLNRATDDKPHQGVVLFADPLAIAEFEPDVPPADASGRPPVLLALDEIHDAQNFGAVLRSAHFLGCHGVLTSMRHSAPLSPAVLRASVGAAEVLVAEGRLWETRNMHQAIAMSKDLGWDVVGACSGAKSISADTFALTKPTILVMGNEHRGLKSNIKQCCDAILTIPGAPQDAASKVDSLNVSVAAGILMYQLLHGH